MPPPSISAAPPARLVALLTVGGALAVVGIVSRLSLLIVCRDGAMALVILAAATGLGLWLVQAIGLRDVQFRWQILLGVGLGSGSLSLLVLALGALGCLNRALWLALLTMFIAAGFFAAGRLVRRAALASKAPPATSLHWLWLTTAFFGGLGLVGATLPPGVCWPAEGNAYDVLEYHLAVPREYLEAGRIGYLPHNIYSNFPFGVEMLYLLAMVVHGEAVPAVFTAQLLHALFGALAVAASWLAAREIHPAGAVVAAVATASSPFMPYLSALAYVENAMLFFTALAFGATLRAARNDDPGAGRWFFAAGLCAGLACGCKYTVVPALIVPLAVAALWHGLARPARTTRPLFQFVIGAAISFGPWLVKNTVTTGNPVFPLGRSVFPERAGVWDDDGAARWSEGHRPAPADRPPLRRLAKLWREVFGSPVYGPGPALAIVGWLSGVAAARRRRSSPAATRAIGEHATPGPAAVCWIMILFGLAIWLTFTHLVWRFAVWMIVPLCILGAGAWSTLHRPLGRTIGFLALAALVALNARTTWTVFSSEGGVNYLDLAAQRVTDGLEWISEGHLPTHGHVPRLNAIVAAGGRVLMVGDARRLHLSAGVDYCVVFSRNPFAEAARTLAPGRLLAWLAERGYTHVHVDWSEMRRLGGSRYGFWKGVDEELFRRLVEAGLRPVETFTFPPRDQPYATLFEVPRPSTTGPATAPAS